MQVCIYIYIYIYTHIHITLDYCCFTIISSNSYTHMICIIIINNICIIIITISSPL